MTSYSTVCYLVICYRVATVHKYFVTTSHYVGIDVTFDVDVCISGLAHSCGEEAGDSENTDDTLHPKPGILASDAGGDAVDGGGTDKPTFPNQFPKHLQVELESAGKLGVKPVEVGDPEFQTIIQAGDVKWAVTEDEQLLFIPKRVNGIEIYHTVLTNGEPVLAAGEATIINTGNGYSAIEFDRWSGHFQPDEASLIVGREAFTKAGINFPPPILGLRW